MIYSVALRKHGFTFISGIGGRYVMGSANRGVANHPTLAIVDVITFIRRTRAPKDPWKEIDKENS